MSSFDDASLSWANGHLGNDDSAEPSRRKNTRNSKPAFKKFKEIEPGSLKLDDARETGLRILTRTQKSAFELEQALIKKGATPEVANTVVQRFIQVELLDDARLAKGIVNTRVALKGESARSIRRELDRRGLSDHADSALEELDRDAEFANAAELAVARMRRLANLDRETRMRRLSSYLARKGYSGEVIGRAIRNAEAQAKIEL